MSELNTIIINGKKYKMTQHEKKFLKKSYVDVQSVQPNENNLGLFGSIITCPYCKSKIFDKNASIEEFPYSICPECYEMIQIQRVSNRTSD